MKHGGNLGEQGGQGKQAGHWKEAMAVVKAGLKCGSHQTLGFRTKFSRSLGSRNLHKLLQTAVSQVFPHIPTSEGTRE